MLMLVDFLPRFCPSCGQRNDVRGTLAEQDFTAKCSFSCRNCSLSYQYVPREQILDAAERSGGDLKWAQEAMV